MEIEVKKYTYYDKARKLHIMADSKEVFDIMRSGLEEKEVDFSAIKQTESQKKVSEEVSEIIEMYENMTIQQIATKTGLSPTTVYRRLVKQGVKLRTKGTTMEMNKT